MEGSGLGGDVLEGWVAVDARVARMMNLLRRSSSSGVSRDVVALLALTCLEVPGLDARRSSSGIPGAMSLALESRESLRMLVSLPHLACKVRRPSSVSSSLLYFCWGLSGVFPPPDVFLYSHFIATRFIFLGSLFFLDFLSFLIFCLYSRHMLPKLLTREAPAVV